MKIKSTICIFFKTLIKIVYKNNMIHSPFDICITIQRVLQFDYLRCGDERRPTINKPSG